MEEEKKNNKGLMVGIIIFLIICLVAIFYFMFKMVYVEEKKTPEENNNTETTVTNDVVFTELTKYELQEGEEKEVTVDGKQIKLSKKENKSYINDKEIEASGFYVTNKFIISTGSNIKGSGVIRTIYDSNGTIIYEGKETDEIFYHNLILENGRIYVDGEKMQPLEGIEFNKMWIVPCVMGGKSIREYSKEIEASEDEIISGQYEIKYNNSEISIELIKSIQTAKEYINQNQNLCIRESN